jgi:hypothetical protein
MADHFASFWCFYWSISFWLTLRYYRLYKKHYYLRIIFLLQILGDKKTGKILGINSLKDSFRFNYVEMCLAIVGKDIQFTYKISQIPRKTLLINPVSFYEKLVRTENYQHDFTNFISHCSKYHAYNI